MKKQEISLNGTTCNVLQALKSVQAEHGYLPAEAMTELAAAFGVPVHRIYGVATFYSFLTVRPGARHTIRVCKSLPCAMKNGQNVVEALERELGISPGETTPDGRFALEQTGCIGLCDQAPAMLIDNDPHVDLTPERISRILQGYQ